LHIAEERPRVRSLHQLMRTKRYCCRAESDLIPFAGGALVAQISDQQALTALSSDQLLPVHPPEHRLAWWVNEVSENPFKSKYMAFLVRNNSLLTIFVNQVVLFS
jgi:hypothetical protein